MTGNIVAISEAVSLGFHGMGLLAASRKRLSAREMAEQLGVSEAHLTKVFQRLVREGLVGSVRGPGGGFELRTDPGAISLLSVYYAIEGVPKGGRHFCSCCDKCPFESCLFGTVLENSASAFMEYLSKVTLNTVFFKPEETTEEEIRSSEGNN